MARGALPYIVDADEDRREAICEMLSASWDCRVFSTIDEFLDEHQGNQRGCVIVGVDAARTGSALGIGVSATLQSRRDDLPVILLTGRPDVAGVAEAIRGGAFDCLTMPVRPERLLQCVEQAIEEYDRRRQTREMMLQLRNQMEHMTHRQRQLVGWICSNLPPHEASQLIRNANGNGNGNGHGHRLNGHGADGKGPANGNGHSDGAGDGEGWAGFDADQIQSLPRRVRQTLDFLLRGASEKQIATRLKISKHTVHDYVKSLYKRLEVSSRGELLAKCLGGFAGVE